MPIRNWLRRYIGVEEILERLRTMADTIDDVLNDVAELKTVTEGMATTMDHLSAQVDALEASGVDPAKLASLRASIAGIKAAGAEAITRNTRAAGAP